MLDGFFLPYFEKLMKDLACGGLVHDFGGPGRKFAKLGDWRFADRGVPRRRRGHLPNSRFEFRGSILLVSLAVNSALGAAGLLQRRAAVAGRRRSGLAVGAIASD